MNGSEANGGIPDPNFSFTIEKAGGKAEYASTFFNVKEPALEQWNFTWYEGEYCQYVPLELRPSRLIIAQIFSLVMLPNHPWFA